MKKGRQSNIKYKELSIQEETGKKLVNQYVGPYFINEVVSTNVVKLQLPTSIRIHPVVNISVVQRTSRETKDKRGKTSRNR